MSAALGCAWIVFRKELLDALRDRRTLLMVLVSSVAIGPLVLLLISTLVSDMEERALKRQVVALGLQHAPTLRNYIERQTYVVLEAPQDFKAQLRRQVLGDPVLVVGSDFEARLAQGELPVVEIVGSSANTRIQAGMARMARLLQGFNLEQASLRAAWRGMASGTLQAVEVDEQDLADPGSRSAQLTTMVPFFVLMAVLYGALNAALDSTAGERERGSLEPLMTSPASHTALVVGKWAAVAAVAMLIALLSCASFLPGQWLLRNETLAAVFRFGPHEAMLFLLLLLPLAGALSALLMAIAIGCRSFKEAQASATVVVLAVSLLPLLVLFNQEGEAAWFLWVPTVAQTTMMGRVLKAEPLTGGDVFLPAAVCLLLAVLCLAFVVRSLHRAAVK